MPTTPSNPSERSDFEVAADLGRRDAERVPEHYDLHVESSLVVARVRNDETIRIVDLEEHLDAPRNARGHADLHDPTGFVSYVNRLADQQHTTVWADENANTVTAVLDDHHDRLSAGWRRHTVKLTLRPDPDWLRWMALNEQLVPQTQFAYHIDGNYHLITRPDAATMREVAMSMSGKRNVTFNQQVRMENNDFHLNYVEETTATAGRNGTLEVPQDFDVQLSPFVGCDPIILTARLCYAIDNGQLRIGYQLIRPDLVKRDVFESLVRRITDELTGDIPVLYGTAPASLR